MPEKKLPEKNKPLPELRPSVTEILVANGRAFQPFIRTFRYTGENVTKQNLGTLLGVFEIDDQSEDSAYIVNFLASVAKKEYFNNPRRGAIESFEAALHKINLALAELVKHGNVTWLGKFHGALGVLEKNNLHFSVSGHAAILLLRGGTIADISEGLASDESHIHPIKTFVEVSSGRLSAEDQILLSSPELPALFSLEELNRHATRMGNDGFTQFLKTALVNELDMAGLMVVDVIEGPTHEEEQRIERKSTPKPPIRVSNVFSQSAFTEKKPDEAPSIKETLIEKQREKEEEYIDSKTGHIYVQGDTPEVSTQHPFFEVAGSKLQEAGRAFSIGLSSLGKRLRKARKQTALMLETVSAESQALGRKVARALRRRLRKYQEEKEEKRAQREAAILAEETEKKEAAKQMPSRTQVVTPSITVSDIPKPQEITPRETPLTSPVEPILSEDTPTETEPVKTVPEFPSFMKSKLAQFYQKENQPKVVPETIISPSIAEELKEPEENPLNKFTTTASSTLKAVVRVCTEKSRLFFKTLAHLTTRLPSRKSIVHVIRPLIVKTTLFFHTLPSRRKYFLLGGVVVLCVGVGSWYFFSTTKPSPEVQPSAQNEADPTATPASQNTLASGELSVALSTLPETVVTSVILNDQTYVITEKNIVTVTDHQVFPFPAGNRAQFAAAMDDLRLIFIYTETGKLYAWSPISKTFVENTLPADNLTTVAGIDTYLTYLYVLESGSDQVYRFPRADGGFGAGTSWLREAVAVEKTSRLAVNETLFIAPDTNTIKGFFRGRSSSTLEVPGSGLSLTDLYTHPGLENVYALDSEHHQILIWNQDGRLIKTISHDKFSEGQSLSVNEKQGEFFIGTQNSLLSYKLK